MPPRYHLPIGLLVGLTSAAAGDDLDQTYLRIARDAARAHQCDIVRELGTKVGRDYFAKVFHPDPIIANCYARPKATLGAMPRQQSRRLFVVDAVEAVIHLGDAPIESGREVLLAEGLELSIDGSPHRVTTAELDDGSIPAAIRMHEVFGDPAFDEDSTSRRDAPPRGYLSIQAGQARDEHHDRLIGAVEVGHLLPNSDVGVLARGVAADSSLFHGVAELGLEVRSCGDVVCGSFGFEAGAWIGRAVLPVLGPRLGFDFGANTVGFRVEAAADYAFLTTNLTVTAGVTFHFDHDPRGRDRRRADLKRRVLEAARTARTDCDRALGLGNAVRKDDSAVHTKVFLTDPAVARCRRIADRRAAAEAARREQVRARAAAEQARREQDQARAKAIEQQRRMDAARRVYEACRAKREVMLHELSQIEGAAARSRYASTIPLCTEPSDDD